MAAKPAAPTPSPIAAPGDQGRSAPRDRFASFDTPRYYTEVSVAGYDVTKRLALNKRREKLVKRIASRPAAPSAAESTATAPVQEPIVLATKPAGRRTRQLKSRVLGLPTDL